MIASFLFVAVLIGRYQSLGAAISLISGLAAGTFLVLFYGWIFKHHHLSAAGKASLAVLPASAVIGALLIRRLARKTALLYPEPENDRAGRIIVVANLITAVVSMAAIVSLALIVHAV